MLKKYSVWLPALLLSLSHLAAQVNVAVVFDRQNIETGDTFTMRVLVTGTNAKPNHVNFTPWDAVIPTENVLRRGAWTHLSDRWASEYTLIVFDAVDTILPPLGVVSLAGESALSNPVPLKVTATPAPNDIEKMEPIRDIRHEPLLWTDYALVLGIILLIYALYRYFTGKKKPRQIIQQAPVDIPPAATPAHIIALQKLKRLEQSKPWKSGDIKGYYADLSSIIREYLESRYRFPATESTTREVETLMKAAALQDGKMATVLSILRQTDLAKYAQALDPDKPHEQYLLKAEDFVQKTAEETI